MAKRRRRLAAGFIAAVMAGIMSFSSLAFFTNSEHAYAQTSQSPSPPTQQMLQECKELGISPEKCSENEILKHRCLGAVGSPCGSSSSVASQPELSPFVVEILAGSGIAFVASIFGIRKLRAIKKKRTTGDKRD
ncbi:hypothetical protein [Nitrososphaera viennensis]|uniref:Uncharacterized protein n=1 Tax=Nitrososphaera viennensis TaxID=1034015 RepID=A0A977IEF7_9ARCH|nr:hypothetical protein [Nitrososphaera viennensis]UVS69262.1 hypothetical protein NWT39_00390 [Nitrososphaera viennensis]